MQDNTTELWRSVQDRLHRMGAFTHEAQVIALEKEIRRYRSRLESLQMELEHRSLQSPYRAVRKSMCDYHVADGGIQLRRILATINNQGYELISASQHEHTYTVFFRRPTNA